MNSQSLISLADTYAHHYGVTHWAVSYRALGKGDFFVRLTAGRECTIRTYNKVLQWFSNNWPLDLPWPADIPRPDPAPDSPAMQKILNQIKIDSESPLRKLNKKGQIAAPDAFVASLPGIIPVSRASFDQVIRQYRDDGPRARTRPRAGSSAEFILEHLVAAHDSRFSARIKADARGRLLARQMGLAG